MAAWQAPIKRAVQKIIKDPGHLDDVVALTFDKLWSLRMTVATEPAQVLPLLLTIARRLAVNRNIATRRRERREGRSRVVSQVRCLRQRPLSRLRTSMTRQLPPFILD